MDSESAADRDGPCDYLVTPEVGRGPGVLVLHSGRGLTGFVTGFCQRLARDGFVALAPDLFDGETPTTPGAAKAATDAIDEDALGRRLADTTRFLRRHDAVSRPDVGVIGIGYGAALACRLLDDGALEPGVIVLFYGLSPTDWTWVDTAVSGHFAELDPELPESRVRELREQLDDAGLAHDLFVYPGSRPSFFETGATAEHDPDAAQLAWKRTSRFLTTHLG